MSEIKVASKDLSLEHILQINKGLGLIMDYDIDIELAYELGNLKEQLESRRNSLQKALANKLTKISEKNKVNGKAGSEDKKTAKEEGISVATEVDIKALEAKINVEVNEEYQKLLKKEHPIDCPVLKMENFKDKVYGYTEVEFTPNPMDPQQPMKKTTYVKTKGLPLKFFSMIKPILTK